MIKKAVKQLYLVNIYLLKANYMLQKEPKQIIKYKFLRFKSKPKILNISRRKVPKFGVFQKSLLLLYPTFTSKYPKNVSFFKYLPVFRTHFQLNMHYFNHQTNVHLRCNNYLHFNELNLVALSNQNHSCQQNHLS